MAHRHELKGNRDGQVDELEHEGGDEGDSNTATWYRDGAVVLTEVKAQFDLDKVVYNDI